MQNINNAPNSDIPMQGRGLPAPLWQYLVDILAGCVRSGNQAGKGACYRARHFVRNGYKRHR